jgi:probable F420-dependent oxidoreductase
MPESPLILSLSKEEIGGDTKYGSTGGPMPSPLKIGLFGLHRGECTDPAALTRVARAAESAGLESLWVGDHIVMPTDTSRSRGMRWDDPRLEAVVALTYLAAQTNTIRLGVGVIVLPQRQPLVLARQLASLDVLSGGRLIFGIGVGWLEPELNALGVALAERGGRTDEYLTVLRGHWDGSLTSFDGRYVQFTGVQARPSPVQRPHPPIVVGGYAPAALRRTIEQANGWYGYAIDLAATEKALAGLREAASRYERSAALGPLEISVSPPPGPVDPATAERYAALGVHRLLLLPGDNRETTLLQLVEQAQGQLIGRV